MGLIEPLREVHIAGPGGIVVADMDTLAVKQVVNTSTLLRLADADHTGVTIGTEGVVCTSSNFLPNNGRPVWVVSIRGAGVFVPDIGIYSFDAVSWRLVAAHSPLENRVWLPIEASDSRLVMDGGDVERSRFQYRVLYDTKTGFDAYPVPITQVLQTTAPSESAPQLVFGINNLNSSTGVAAFTALNFTACTSLCPWPPGCVLQQPKVNLAAACSPNSFESTHYYWYNLYWGPFSPSMFGMMVTFASADDSTHICLADVDPAKGYSVVAATTSKLPSNVDRRFAWSVEAFGDSGRRRLASVIGFYPPHAVSADASAWFFVNRDYNGLFISIA
ncbi:uncharacterized protein ACA1_136810 [Acanthamoeba castellanii str. Neff]|uniref:Uncharacterized protein n=1 Tax=Acanthamoeba castellanii (strain ATCC 30010 / Neff) TaxID=1257118 RepID=L8GZD4_ACACF|nr:uncharacterized protein ACA1_136810 [Acanthamoeba castellanii str. Neff]ELR18370.1 hypothetical protein ACA1_136810 [Acanthamoeba castellanii str. Neff]